MEADFAHCARASGHTTSSAFPHPNEGSRAGAATSVMCTTCEGDAQPKLDKVMCPHRHLKRRILPNMLTWILLFLAAVVVAFVAAYLMFRPSDTVVDVENVVEVRRDRRAS